MRYTVAVIAGLVALPLHAQQIYRCADKNGPSFQDHPCGTAAPVGGYQQAEPAPAPSAADHYRAYLQMSEHDEAQRRQQRLAAAASAPPSPAALSETDRRAVFNCNADQRVDELRHGRPTYTCDQRTGEKKLVEQVIVVDRDGRR